MLGGVLSLSLIIVLSTLCYCCECFHPYISIYNMSVCMCALVFSRSKHLVLGLVDPHG